MSESSDAAQSFRMELPVCRILQITRQGKHVVPAVCRLRLLRSLSALKQAGDISRYVSAGQHHSMIY